MVRTKYIFCLRALGLFRFVPLFNATKLTSHDGVLPNVCFFFINKDWEGSISSWSEVCVLYSDLETVPLSTQNRLHGPLYRFPYTPCAKWSIPSLPGRYHQLSTGRNLKYFKFLTILVHRV